DDVVVDRRPAAGVELPPGGDGGDRLVVGLGAAVERGEQVRSGSSAVQRIDVATQRGADEGDQLVVLDPHFLAGVEVEVADLDRDARAGATQGLVERAVGGDQMAVDRVAQVGQVQAAEGP